MQINLTWPMVGLGFTILTIGATGAGYSIYRCYSVFQSLKHDAIKTKDNADEEAKARTEAARAEESRLRESIYQKTLEMYELKKERSHAEMESFKSQMAAMQRKLDTMQQENDRLRKQLEEVLALNHSLQKERSERQHHARV